MGPRTIRHLAPSLLLLLLHILLLQQGSWAKEPDCRRSAVRAKASVWFFRKRRPTCGQCWPFGTSRETREFKEFEAISCQDVCDERIADFMYEISKFRLDPCMRLMNSNNLSEWDILFRDPNGEQFGTAQNGVKHCICAVTMMVQRLVLQLPDTDPCQPPLAPDLCDGSSAEDRMVKAKLEIIAEPWYPELSTKDSYPEAQDMIWTFDNLNTDRSQIYCNAEWQDFQYPGDTRGQGGSEGQRDSNSNCTIKFGYRENPLWGKVGLSCTPGVWGGIQKRLLQLYEKDPDGQAYRNDMINLRYQFAKELSIRHETRDSSLRQLLMTAVAPHELFTEGYREFR
ncbi:hypothetical protein BCR37DRAFT_91740 [Protomyces lactucae-debilis]|uniref:Uncharacterized protein n=1 Tax=Protomyces lactucae-debilis TaxID=2754530 RepID=A0A1Y2F6D8_PROLT|nr:uncharacterized protein BCR37DRAFT_91740 [Protomyces lactucae-debilis]ORY79443.1 hypothetical protein BCR37DRAFT_91740 [Protomyces lactucae-debilis]